MTSINSKSHNAGPTGALVVAKSSDGPVYEAKWRRAGRQIKRRVGPAWLEHAPDGKGWRPRRGRVPDGYLDEKRATVRMAEMIAEHEQEERAIEAGEQERREHGVSFRELAAEWLEYLERERGAKPSTLRDYRYMLAEPGTPHRRGKGKQSRRRHGSVRRPADRQGHDAGDIGIPASAGRLGHHAAHGQQASPGALRDLQLRAPHRHPRSAVQPGRGNEQAPRAPAGGDRLL